MQRFSIEELQRLGLPPTKIIELIELELAANRKRLDGECWVYVIYNPIKRIPLYIGISSNPWRRFEDHRSDPACAPYHYIRKFLDLGFSSQQIMKPYKRCCDRREALSIEFRLVEATPGLVNRQNQV